MNDIKLVKNDDPDAQCDKEEDIGKSVSQLVRIISFDESRNLEEVAVIKSRKYDANSKEQRRNNLGRD